MTLAVEFDFPAAEATTAIQWLQTAPGSMVTRLQHRPTVRPPFWQLNPAKPLTAEEQQAILDSFAAPLLPGEETAEEMIARIYGDHRDAPRDVEL